MKKQHIYLALCIVGTLVPYSFLPNILYEHNGSFDVVRFASEISSNFSSRFVLADLSISVLTFLVFVALDHRRKNTLYWWLSLFALPLVGLSLGFPLYLYLRERSTFPLNH